MALAKLTWLLLKLKPSFTILILNGTYNFIQQI